MMKLKLKKLPEGNPGPLVINVVHGASDDEESGDAGERHTSKLNIGQTITCVDSLGQAILAKYGKWMVNVDGYAEDDDPEEKPVKKAQGKPGPKPKANKTKAPVIHDADGQVQA